ncbi:hypothetical protein [Methylobacter luteus]|uniref:hypothetical protein n=1 Tax=Methylobacter luteus TaxID=415 RepID=UPI00041D5020|nr:hypothetical protein [Methylobacter luteus]
MLGSESELENYLSEKNIIDKSTFESTIKTTNSELPISSTVIEINNQSLLIDKYLSIIKTRQDLLKIPAEDRAEIKKVFNSEFRFFSCLQDKIINN